MSKLAKTCKPKEGKMETIKEFSTAWIRQEITTAREGAKSNEGLTLTLLLSDLERYADYLERRARIRGAGKSPRKAAASSANGKKGGRPKGSKNKPKTALFTPEDLEAWRSLPHASHDDKADALALVISKK